MNYVQKVPVAICGVALGFAALGNLFKTSFEGFYLACGIISIALLALYTLKFMVSTKVVLRELSDPIGLSVAATYPMAVMLISVYMKADIGDVAQLFWFAGIALHILCIALFTSRYIAKFDWENVHASWFIVYVGIVVASVTAPAFNFETSVGTVVFWFGFICLVVLFIVVSIRYVKYGPVPDSAESLACIYAAPTSLCIAGYIQSITPKSVPFLLVMLAIASLIYVVSFVWCIRCLTKPFFPSHAAFTFPFVICVVARTQTSAYLAELGQPLQWLDGIATVETVLAAGLCIVVLVRLLAFVRNQTLPKARSMSSLR